MHHVQTLKDAGNLFSKRKSWYELNFPSVLFWEGTTSKIQDFSQGFFYAQRVVGGRCDFGKFSRRIFEAEGIHLELRTSPFQQKKRATQICWGKYRHPMSIEPDKVGFCLYLFGIFGYHFSDQVRFRKEEKLMFRFIFTFLVEIESFPIKEEQVLDPLKKTVPLFPKKVTFPSMESLHKAYTLSSKLVEPVSPSLTYKYHKSIQILYQYLYCTYLYMQMNVTLSFCHSQLLKRIEHVVFFFGAFLRGRGICAAQPPD